MATIAIYYTKFCIWGRLDFMITIHVFVFKIDTFKNFEEIKYTIRVSLSKAIFQYK